MRVNRSLHNITLRNLSVYQIFLRRKKSVLYAWHDSILRKAFSNFRFFGIVFRDRDILHKSLMRAHSYARGMELLCRTRRSSITVRLRSQTIVGVIVPAQCKVIHLKFSRRHQSYRSIEISPLSRVCFSFIRKTWIPWICAIHELIKLPYLVAHPRRQFSL